MNNTAILLATSREKGNTKALVNSVVDKTDSSFFNLKDYNFSPYDYEHKNTGDDFLPLILDLLKHDHLVFATPVYWYSMSAQMKVFFDRLSDLLHVKKYLGRQLRKKHCSIISTGASLEPERCFEETFIHSFKYLGMNYQGMLYCYCEDSFDENIHKKSIDHYIQDTLLKTI